MSPPGSAFRPCLDSSCSCLGQLTRRVETLRQRRVDFFFSFAGSTSVRQAAIAATSARGRKAKRRQARHDIRKGRTMHADAALKGFFPGYVRHRPDLIAEKGPQRSNPITASRPVGPGWETQLPTRSAMRGKSDPRRIFRPAPIRS